MDKGKIAFAVYASLHGADTPCTQLSDVKAGLPATRRINRMGRAALAFDGNLACCTDRHLLATFRSIEAALDSACEMHRRCAELPQLAGWRIDVRIAIHSVGARACLIDPPAALTEKPRPKNAKPPVIEVAARLAGMATDTKIVVSQSVFEALSPATICYFSPITRNRDKQTAHSFNWKELPASRNITTTPRSFQSCAYRLILQFGSRQKILGNSDCVVAIGRDPACHFVIRNRFVSRIHALIEIRPDGCFIKDQSSNGTSLLQSDGEEINIRNTSLMLSGRGKIAFGQSVKNNAEHCLNFEIIEGWPQALRPVDTKIPETSSVFQAAG